MELRSLLVTALVFSIAACGAPSGDGRDGDRAPQDPESANDVDLAGDSAEGTIVLEFLNDGGATFEVLDQDVGLDRRAAENLVVHRDGADRAFGTADDDLFDSMDEVDAVAWVGPASVQKLVDYVTVQGWVSQAGGSFEGVTFTSAEVLLALDLTNLATQATLDDEVKLDSRAAENIVAARPIPSMTRLAEVPWVGPAALERIRAFLPSWQEQGTTLESYDGVAFTHAEAAAALAAANLATPAQLAAAGIGGAQDDILLAGRPWASLGAVTATSGIGPLTTLRLKLLGVSFAGAPMYVVTASDAAELAALASDALRDDEGFGSEMLALLHDVTDDVTWMDGVLIALSDAFDLRLSSFAASRVGQSYSSRDAAFFDVWTYGKGLQFAARTDYPEGALQFLAPLSEGKKLARAKKGVLAWWEKVFVHTPAWQSTFGGKTWNDVKAQVTADVSAFQNGPSYGAYAQGHATTFVGTVYGLYTEVTVDDVGKVTHVYAEID